MKEKDVHASEIEVLMVVRAINFLLLLLYCRLSGYGVRFGWILSGSVKADYFCRVRTVVSKIRTAPSKNKECPLQK